MTISEDALAQGWRHHQAGNLSQAEPFYRRALQLDPASADGWNLLGVLLTDLRRLDDAAACFREAIRCRPGHADFHNNLGVTVAQQGDFSAAALHFHEALRLRPDYGEAHCNLGNLLREQGRMQDAAACYRAAVRLSPNHAEAHNNLGIALTELARHDEAVASLRRALQLRPNYAEAYNNLAIALRDQGHLESAVEHYRQAVTLKPDYPDALNHLGMALMELGRCQEARDAFEQALRLRPDFPEARGNRGMALLQQGDYAQGWTDYNWRWHCRGFLSRTFAQPLWDGTSLDGRTILLHTEQGLGDTIHFIRYAALVKARGGTVIVECPAALQPLLSTCSGIDRFVTKAEETAFDVHCPLLNLPAVFGTTVETIPANVPYLHADAGLVEHWRRELGPCPAFQVGINWSGNPKNPTQHYRTIPPGHFAALAAVPGVRLISLQKGAAAAQIRDWAGKFAVDELPDDLDGPRGAFTDTAAIIQNLDLVVSSDTSIAHLAGALGAPVWTAIPFAPDWRWLPRARDRSPWYPTMRLFRQAQCGNWDEVFARMAESLREAVARRRSGERVSIDVSPGELLDRIARCERVGPAEELAALCAARDRTLGRREALTAFAEALRALHEQLEDIEKVLRGETGPGLVPAVREWARLKSQRAELLTQIDSLCK